MASLAAFPKLRRTLTDVMEDELYHVPQTAMTNSHGGASSNNNASNMNSPTLSFTSLNLIGSQFLNPNGTHSAASLILQNHNSNNTLNNQRHSTVNPKLYRNSSALNSEEMLTIPDHEGSSLTRSSSTVNNNTNTNTNTHSNNNNNNNNNSNSNSNQQHHHHNNNSHKNSNNHELYYDIPEPLPLESNIFNEFADPNLTTTGNNGNYNFSASDSFPQHQQPTTSAPTKLLKFNDDLTLDYFNNEEDDSKFLIWPAAISPNLIPEEIEEEEISDEEEEEYEEEEEEEEREDEEEEDGDLTFLENSFDASQGIEDVEMRNPVQDDDTNDLESDIDRMSLVSSDDEYSSNSSVLEESYTPTFKTHYNMTPPVSRHGSYTHKEVSHLESTVSRNNNDFSFKGNNILSNNDNLNNVPPFKKIGKKNLIQVSLKTSAMNNQSNVHQCTLINPSTNQPCMKQFSRPYDLIRHQETIHASRKKIFRCVVCNKLEGGVSSKTFSRGDALSRHIRVKHGLTGTEATDALQYAKDHVEYV